MAPENADKLSKKTPKRKELFYFNKLINKPYVYEVLFWILFATTSSILIVFNLEGGLRDWLFNIYFGSNQSDVGRVLVWVCACVFLSTLFVLFKLINRFEIQRLRIQPSCVFYAYWALINTFVFYAIFYFLTWRFNWYFMLFPPLILILGKVFGEVFGKNPDLSFKYFAAGSVGSEKDEFGFVGPAKNVAAGLLKLEGHVSVVGLYGGFGFGKSSYARMILENFDPNKTLYTYISLTETNEAKDFSNLFSERWSETLVSRYPKIDITSYLPFMNAILRESGNSILSEILGFVSSLNRGLVGTKAFFFDKLALSQKPEFVPQKVAGLFGNITEIKEDHWVILLDEIERAQLDEIYRLVEIIERFKNEGRLGVPVKLMFIFCISEPNLEKYLNAFSDKDPRARLLTTFFYEDSKSFTHKIFLPPVGTDRMREYVMGNLDKIIKQEGIKLIGKITPFSIAKPSGSFMKHQDAVGYTVAMLAEKSPRTFSRILCSLDLFYGSFRDQFGELRKNAIRFNDVVVLEYIKIAHPYLIEFFSKTIYLLVNEAERDNADAYFARKDLENKKMGLIQWIEIVTERQLTEREKIEAPELIGLVMHYYFDFLNKDHGSKNKTDYFGTTSYPEVMCDYLQSLADGTDTTYRRNNRLYLDHQTSKKDFLNNLDNGVLISYARYIFQAQGIDRTINIDLLEELATRIGGGAIKLEPMNVDNTTLDEAAYQFTFQIVAVLEKIRDKTKSNESSDKVFSALRKVLSNATVPTGIKYIILSSLVDSERGSSSSIHFRLISAFQVLLNLYEADMKALIKYVFSETEKRYSDSQWSLYDREENFFYTMYQGWSGSKDASDEINKIRNVATRDLENHPEAIQLYWRKYPYEKHFNQPEDVFEHDRFAMTDTSNPLYMPLDQLISITRKSKNVDRDLLDKVDYWEKIKDSELIKKRGELKDDTTTLKAFLLRNNFL